jgi:hypothetical protein
LCELLTRAAERVAATPNGRDALDGWRQQIRHFLKGSRGGWTSPPVRVASKPSGQATASAGPDGAVTLTSKGKRAEADQLELRPAPGWVATIRLDVLPGSAGGALIQLGAAHSAGDGKAARPIAFAEADADRKEPRYASGSARIGVKDGWKTVAGATTTEASSVWVLERPIHVAEGDRLTVSIKTDRDVRVRVLTSPLASEDSSRPGFPADLLDALATDAGAPAPLTRAFLLGTGYDAEALADYRRVRQGLLECRGGRALSMVTQAREPMPTRVLPRGNWLDESGEVVSPGVPAFLPGPPESAGQRLTRLDLARWLTSPDNPLTARCFVNRLWKQFFGTGLSAVVDDLGAQGEWPSHPELLDWLSVEFRESGWDVKHMVTLLVTSATYRQSARPRADLREADPHNRLLAAQAPRRLEAEFVRDNALAIAGLLDPEVGGPSSHPYQPAGYYANLQFPDRDYRADTDERQYRRGLYTHWQRTFLHPMLANFDAPSREECTASRNVANTPQQALTLLNDPTFVEAARVLAERVLRAEAPTDRERVDFLFQRALARPASAHEQAELAKFLETQRRVYRGDPNAARALVRAGLAPRATGLDPAEHAAWTSVCRVVLNLHETITRF